MKCGSENKDNAQFCSNCGAQLIQPQPQQENLVQPQQAASAPQLQQPNNATPAYQQPVQMPKKKSKAGLIIALVFLGILVLGGVATAGFFIVRAVVSESTDVDDEDDKKSVSEKDINKVEDDSDDEDAQEAEKKAAEEKSEKERAEEEKAEKEKAGKQAELKQTNAKAHRAYGDILIAYNYGNREYLGLEYFDFSDDFFGPRSQDTYSIYDIDSDGIDELLLFSENTYTANMQLNIFYYDEAQNKAVCVDSAISPMATFYSNGVIKCEDLHNQTPSDFWPFSICKYDAANKSIVELGGVRAWDRSYADTDYNVNDFSDDADANGNGRIFEIYENGASRYVDDEEYDNWFAAKIDGGTEVSLVKKEIEYLYDDENIKSEYEKYLVDVITNLCGDNDDLGLAYVSCGIGDNYSDFSSMTSSFVTYTAKDEYGMDFIGTINGVPAVDYFAEDGGSVSYTQAVDGVTLFGIKPGDSFDEAKKKLKSIGFYESDIDNSDECLFINGMHTVSYGIYIEQANGVITKISISFYSRFVG